MPTIEEGPESLYMEPLSNEEETKAFFCKRFVRNPYLCIENMRIWSNFPLVVMESWEYIIYSTMVVETTSWGYQ